MYEHEDLPGPEHELHLRVDVLPKDCFTSLHWMQGG